jgi:phosphatidate cytidylyltransferase
LNAHAKRWLTAIVAVPALFAVILFGAEILFATLILLVIALGIYEYNILAFGKMFRWEKVEGYVLAVLIPVIFYNNTSQAVLELLILSFLAVFLLYIPKIKDEPFDVMPVMKVIFGFMYIPVMMSYLIWLRLGENGVVWIFFVIVLAFSGDVAAFYVGRAFGKKKLIPLVSSGKTIAGTLALFVGSTLCCFIYGLIFMPDLSPIHTIMLGFFGSIIGQLGDLCESVIKRASGVKDSGFILPGHGGILDRLDCLIFIGPFTYYYKTFVIS